MANSYTRTLVETPAATSLIPQQAPEFWRSNGGHKTARFVANASITSSSSMKLDYAAC